MAITNLTLGIGLQGKPTDYTNLYAREYAKKAAADAAKAKQDKDEFNALMKDVEIDMGKVHPTLRGEYQSLMQARMSTLFDDFEKDPRGAIARARRAVAETKSQAQSYFDASNALFTLEKVDPAEVNMPEWFTTAAANPNLGSKGWVEVMEQNKGDLELFGFRYAPPPAEGYSVNIGAMLVPKSELEKEFQAITSQGAMTERVSVTPLSRGGAVVEYLIPNDESLLGYAQDLFKDPNNVRQALINKVDIFDANGNLDEKKVLDWARRNTTKKDYTSRPREGGGSGPSDKTSSQTFNTAEPVAEIAAGGQTYNVFSEGEGLRVGKQSLVSFTAGSDSFEGWRFKIAKNLGERRGNFVGLEFYTVYTGRPIPIKIGDLIPGKDGQMVRSTTEFVVMPGLPIPIEWQKSPEFMSSKLKGRTATRLFQRFDTGTEAGSLDLDATETTVWVPANADNAARVRGAYKGDANIESYLSRVDDKGYLRGGGTQSQQRTPPPSPTPRANTLQNPAPPATGNRPSPAASGLKRF